MLNRMLGRILDRLFGVNSSPRVPLHEEFVLDESGGLNREQANARVIMVSYYYNKRERGDKSSCAEVAALAANTLHKAGLLKEGEALESVTDNLTKYYILNDPRGDITQYIMPFQLQGLDYLEGGSHVFFGLGDPSMGPVVDDAFIQKLITAFAESKTPSLLSANKKSTPAKLTLRLKEQYPIACSSLPVMIPEREKIPDMASSNLLATSANTSESFSFGNFSQIDSSLALSLIQVGLWAGSKLSLCHPPLSAQSPIISKAAVVEASVSRQLSTMGMTIESSLKFLFGKTYVSGNQDTQDKMRNFLMDVVNGNVPSDIGKEFDALANIGNAHERAKQLNTLMESTVSERCLLSPMFLR